MRAFADDCFKRRRLPEDIEAMGLLVCVCQLVFFLASSLMHACNSYGFVARFLWYNKIPIFHVYGHMAATRLLP